MCAGRLSLSRRRASGQSQGLQGIACRPSDGGPSIPCRALERGTCRWIAKEAQALAGGLADVPPRVTSRAEEDGDGTRILEPTQDGGREDANAPRRVFQEPCDRRDAPP